MAGDLFYVFHDHDGVFENVVVDTLENVAVLSAIFRAVAGTVGGVDVTIAELFAVQELTADGELIANAGYALGQRAFSDFLGHGV